MLDQDVADLAGINPSTLSRLLSVQKPIYVEQLDALCEALDLELGALLDAADTASAGRERRLGAEDPDRPIVVTAGGTSVRLEQPARATPSRGAGQDRDPHGR